MGKYSFNLVENELETLRCYMPALLERGNEKLKEAITFEESEDIRLKSETSTEKRFLDDEIVELGICLHS